LKGVIAMINITEWNAITEEDFNAMQFDSGFIVKNFDPDTFTTPTHDDIVDVTSGNIGFTLTPTIVDLGSDVNNLHGVFKELQYISQWSGGQLTYTSLRFNTETYKRNLGAADISGNKVTPRMYLSNNDFENIAWIGKLVGGGLAAIVMKNAMSTGGISISTSKDGKGTNSVTMTGFMSISDQNSVPAEFYAISAIGVELDQHEATVTVGSTVKLNATARPSTATVTWASDNTSEATVSNGAVTGVAAGTVKITASITVDGKTAKDECIVSVSAGA
jgi:hypothetical protein